MHTWDKGFFPLTTTFNSTILLMDATTFPFVAAGATSSINGCSPVNKDYDEIRSYFLINFNSIRIQTAQGQGEFLSGLAHLFRCSGDNEIEFKSYLQSNYKFIFEFEEKDNDKELLSFRNLLHTVSLKFERKCHNVKFPKKMNIE